MDVLIAEHPRFYGGVPQQHQLARRDRRLGLICVYPQGKHVRFCEHAAHLHGELHASCYSLQNFAQWYEPEQRNLLMQSLLLEPEQKGFQIDLRIAWSQQAIRIWFIPCRLQQLYFRCGWVRPLQNDQSFVGGSGKESLSSSSSLRKL